MKVRISLAAMALTALVAAGCGSSNSSSTTSSASSASSTRQPRARGELEVVHRVDRDRGAVHRSGGAGRPRAAALRAAGRRRRQRRQPHQRDAGPGRHPADAVAGGVEDAVDRRLATRSRSIGPAGSQEVEAVGPIFGKAGMAFVSGSATLPALATSGKNPTFFRVVPDDDVQGPQDANYAINHLHPKAVLIIDDDEAYSQGLVNVMIPILKKAGITVDHQTLNGTDTGATLAAAIKSLVTSHLTADDGGGVPAVADGHERADVRPGRQAGRQDDDPVRDRRHQLAVAVQDPGQLRVGVRPRHLDAARARSTSRSSPEWPSTVRTGRSASRRTRPPMS